MLGILRHHAISAANMLRLSNLPEINLFQDPGSDASENWEKNCEVWTGMETDQMDLGPTELGLGIEPRFSGAQSAHCYTTCFPVGCR